MPQERSPSPRGKIGEEISQLKGLVAYFLKQKSIPFPQRFPARLVVILIAFLLAPLALTLLLLSVSVWFFPLFFIFYAAAFFLFHQHVLEVDLELLGIAKARDELQTDLKSQKEKSAKYRSAWKRRWQHAQKDSELIADIQKRRDLSRKSTQDRLTEKEQQSDQLKGQLKDLQRKLEAVRKERNTFKRVSSENERKMKDAQQLTRDTNERMRQATSQYEQRLTDTLDEFELARVLQNLVDRLDSENVQSSLTDDDKQVMAILYGLMHNSYPDRKMLVEVAQIPEEMLRMRQAKTLNDEIFNEIKKVRLDETLTDDERRDKIEVYELRLQQEFGMTE